MRKTFKYRLFTTPLQSELLGLQLGEACRLYNAALEERRDAWKQRVSINYYDQANQLKEIRAAGDLGLANFSCCQDILRRVSKTLRALQLPSWVGSQTQLILVDSYARPVLFAGPGQWTCCRQPFPNPIREE